MTEIINNALTGVNLIPTVLLAIVIIYWITVIIGVIDFDLFDFDIDLDGGGELGPFQSALAYFNLKEIPFMLFFSIVIVNFWIIAMLMCKLPFINGGLVALLLFIPEIIISLFITKIITNPLKGIFKKLSEVEYQGEVVIGQVVTLLCEVTEGRIGQGEIKREGASILINLKPEYEGDIFEKAEEAYVTRRDEEKNLYYIIKIRE
ncbi:MAG: hypothetical protein ACRC2K_08520 [Clostridium sp.]